MYLRTIGYFLVFLAYIAISTSCTESDVKEEDLSLFERRDPSSGIDFENTLEYTEELNPYTYRNFFNGGGVALGDINNDGLLDIYFTGNLVDNQLYLNKGNWQFENITEKAGVACQGVWSSGVTFVDINHDGLLDIYVCKAGPPDNASNRHNELFLNNGNLTFTEKSKDYGLDVTGLSVHASFFDYDLDGDLDCYLLNNSIKAVGAFDFVEDQRQQATTTGNKFFRNDDGDYVDVTEATGIYSSSIGFGLGITVSDLNGDAYPDIFVSNDFFERDYLYINQRDGTYSENLTRSMSSISMGSMGADAADLNNDGLIDLMVTEMLPRTIERQRTKTVFESWNKYNLAVKKGYHHQFSRNALHRNFDNGEFVEVGRMADLSSTEWSWASLIFDADNDGSKDIFVSNGIYKDLLDRDYLTYMANEDKIREMMESEDRIMNKLVDLMPSEPVANAMFKNTGDFRFEDVTKEWGFETPTFSNGSAYGDLDGDGDLDLVINNVNMPAFIYENTSETNSYNFISIKLRGKGQNNFAIGAKVELFFGDGHYSVQENYPSRGFQSSVSYHMIFGLNKYEKVDSIRIAWPGKEQSVYSNLEVNKNYTFSQSEAQRLSIDDIGKQNTNQTLKQTLPIFQFKHAENMANDFNREQLLPEMLSNEGPVITKSDVNDDGIVDIYLGGAKGQSGVLFISNSSGAFTETREGFKFDATSEDTDAVFFDADGDGDDDLYVCSGGKSFSKFDFSLNDRLYINDGKGNFQKSDIALPFKRPMSSSTVSVSDYDKDGDLDLFVGERFKVEVYGLPSEGYMLINQGQRKFELQKISQLDHLGLITDSKWFDIDADGDEDLIVVGEWMPITVLLNDKGRFENRSSDYGFAETSGYWKTLHIDDLDGDGLSEIIAGNKGTNSFFKNGTRMYIADFDNNGTIEQIVCHKRGGKYYPILDRDELISQIASLKRKFLYYKDYGSAAMSDIFDDDVLSKAIIFDIDRVETTLFKKTDEIYKPYDLPMEVQYSSVAAITSGDMNDDGMVDLLFGGNNYLIKPQFGRQDASRGWLVLQNKNGQFNKVQSLGIDGEIRDFATLEYLNKKYLITVINNDSLKFHVVGSK